ncbi:transcriptional regulator [Streptomyces sp. SID3343]|nr:helix-turn-helix domain-containing protein [Streptomyces sp. SID3343]MYW00220.1 transcriptional regulator [Streptomyces sp. SID3343]
MRRGNMISGEARRQMALAMRAMYEAGASIRAVAASTGRSYGSVSRMLAEVGTTMRTRGGARPNRRIDRR